MTSIFTCLGTRFGGYFSMTVQQFSREKFNHILYKKKWSVRKNRIIKIKYVSLKQKQKKILPTEVDWPKNKNTDIAFV